MKLPSCPAASKARSAFSGSHCRSIVRGHRGETSCRPLRSKGSTDGSSVAAPPRTAPDQIGATMAIITVAANMSAVAARPMRLLARVRSRAAAFSGAATGSGRLPHRVTFAGGRGDARTGRLLDPNTIPALWCHET